MALNFKGETTTAVLNNTENVYKKDDLFRLYDAGVLKLGNVVCEHGDFVSWNGTSWQLEKDAGYALQEQVDDIAEKAQTTLEKLLPAFDPNKSVNPDTGFAYNVGESVIYNGEIKMFVNGHTGPWVTSDAITIQLPQIFATSEVTQRLAGNRLDNTQFTRPGRVVEGGKVIQRSDFGDSGLCPCLPGETLYFWRDLNEDPNKFYNVVVYYDIDGKYLTDIISSATIRKDTVPANAYYFSVPIRYDGGVPVKMVVAGFLPNKFIPYFSSHDKIEKVVNDSFNPENVFNPSTATEGSYISAVTNGEEVWTVDSSVGMSDYIPVKNGTLFCWYDYIEQSDLWPFIYYVTYNASKEPVLRTSVGSSKPQILLLGAGTAYIRLQFTLSHKNEIAVGYHKFSRYVPYGVVTPVFTMDLVQETGDSTNKVMSQAAVSRALSNVGIEPETFSLDVTGCETDIIAVARNYILKEFEESGTRYFEFSNDGGKTFARSQNTIGAITFIHFFSTGRALVCGTRNVYYTDDFSSFTETSVYDYDGQPYVPNVDSYYRLGNYNSEYYEIDGKEVLVWNDYNVASGHNSRVWLTDDYGATLKCILKDASTLDDDGNVIDVTHFHRTFVDADGKIYVTSGDDGDLCKLIVGNKNNASWSWHVIGKGNLYKLSQMMIKHPYAIFITDYTDGQNPTGLVCCPVSGLDNPQNFRYIYKNTNNNTLSKYFEDDNGYRLILPDGIGTRKFWFANGNFDFQELSITGGTGDIVLGNIYGPSYNEQVICVAHTNGYSVATNPTLTGYPRFDLGKMMKNAGFKNFGKFRKFFDRLQ